MAKADRYSTAKGETDGGLDDLTRKLADDLRIQIRKLGCVPLFSDEWFDMADVFGRIANVSDMESKLAEDGKLNLCLRNLVDFKLHQRRARILGSGPVFDFAKECDKFERGLGVVLRNAWMHVEAIQTTDLSSLMTHIADTLESSLEAEEDLMAHCSAGDIHQRQEIMVFHYLYCIMRHVEQIKESRVMPAIRDRQVFMKGLRVIDKVHNHVLSAHIVTCLTAMSLITESEDFITFPDQYITNADDVAFLITFRTNCIAKFSTDFEQKKAIRPLTDAIDKAKRQSRFK